MSDSTKIVFVTALHLEAKPLIALLGLKAMPSGGGLRQWVGDDAGLVIAGTGKVNAGIGAAVALREMQAEGRTVAVNFGLCGARDAGVAIGTTVLANRILDVGSGRDWYPEMLWRHEFEEGALATHDRVVTDPDCAGAAFVDMEAAGFMAGAVPVVGAAGVVVLKVVSDHLSCTCLAKDAVTSALAAAAPGVVTYARAVAAALPETTDLLAGEAGALLAEAGERWRLSVTRRHQLRKAAIGWCVRTGESPAALLTTALASEAETREAATVAFGNLLEALNAG